MLSKHYGSTEVDRRTWLLVPPGTLWSTSSDTHQVVEIQKEASAKMYTPCQKCQNKVKARRDGVINPQNYNFNEFLNTEKLMLSKRYESTEVDRRTWLHVPSGTLWSTSSDTHQVVEIQKEASTKM